MSAGDLVLPFLLACCGTDELGLVERAIEEIDVACSDVAIDGEIAIDVGGDPPDGKDGWWDGDHAISLRSYEPHVIAHELGHAMGLAHERDRLSVMHDPAAPLNLPDAAKQIAELCRRHPCRKVRLR